LAAAASSPAEQTIPIDVVPAEDCHPVPVMKGLLLLVEAELGEPPAVQEQFDLEQDLRLPVAVLASRHGSLRAVHLASSFKYVRTSDSEIQPRAGVRSPNVAAVAGRRALGYRRMPRLIPTRIRLRTHRFFRPLMTSPRARRLLSAQKAIFLLFTVVLASPCCEVHRSAVVE
jgi:hypothetical protein